MIRELLAELTGLPELARRVGADDDLLMAGVNSGDLIRLVLAVEERCDTQIDADDLAELTTISAFERVVAREMEEKCG